MISRFHRAALIAAALPISASAFAQQTVTVDPFMVVLETDHKTISLGKAQTLDFLIMDSKSMAPSVGLDLSASISMPSMMGMTLGTPRVSKGKKAGHYDVTLTFPHSGAYRIVLQIGAGTGAPTMVGFSVNSGKAKPETSEDEMAGMAGMSGMDAMNGMSMKGALGNWSMSREGSGTSWQPDASPMFMKMLPSIGGFDLSTMGSIQAGYVDPGSKRVGSQFFDNSMIMLMAQRDLKGGKLGLNFMTSLDPIFNGERGVPDLFQTGETSHGVPLVDRQHPHNLFSEIAASYSHPLSRDWSGFVYGGPVGEPALGDVMFMHRASGMELPEAPISHHWFDSTHISFGVATLGVVYREKWKLEGSVFNGHEPGENRYSIQPIQLNSGSGRLTYNPGKEWSLSSSYGYLNSPEALSPGVNEHRLTNSVAYSHGFRNGDNVSVTAYLGENYVEGLPGVSNGWLAEATYYHAKDAFFTRFERVDKDELYNVPAGNYVVNKLLFGDTHNLYTKDQLEYGLGAYAGVYSYPGSLDQYYGKNPLTLGIFFRIRPSKM